MRKKNISTAHKIFIWVYFITLLFLFGFLLHNLFSFCFYKISTAERKVHKEHGTFPRKEQSEMIWHVFVMKIMIGNALFIPGRENLIKNTTLFHTEGPSCTVHFHDYHKRLFLSILGTVCFYFPTLPLTCSGHVCPPRYTNLSNFSSNELWKHVISGIVIPSIVLYPNRTS